MTRLGLWLLGGICLLAPMPAVAQSKARGPSGNPAAWFGPENYPAAAIRASEQGRVIAEIQIDDTGKIVSCKVIESSGSASLDQATCAIALQDRYYSPASDRQGRPIASRTKLAVRWVLPNGALGKPLDVTDGPPVAHAVTMTLTIGGDGVLEGCHAEVTGRRPGDTSDPCDRMTVGSKVSAGFRRDGHPVGAKIVTRVSEEVLIDP